MNLEFIQFLEEMKGLLWFLLYLSGFFIVIFSVPGLWLQKISIPKLKRYYGLDRMPNPPIPRRYSKNYTMPEDGRALRILCGIVRHCLFPYWSKFRRKKLEKELAIYEEQQNPFYLSCRIMIDPDYELREENKWIRDFLYFPSMDEKDIRKILLCDRLFFLWIIFTIIAGICVVIIKYIIPDILKNL